jgi:DNA gyrase subunit A
MLNWVGIDQPMKMRETSRAIDKKLWVNNNLDTSVYDAMVRLAQPFSLNHPLVDGHGNYGNTDGDPPAHYRYSEAKLSKVGEIMLKDIEKNTVDWKPNFSEDKLEPVVLPARLPQLLINGTTGI